MADYDVVARGPLKLKKTSDVCIKKKKKKRKLDKEMLEKGVVKATEGSEEETFVIIKKTPAQLAFEKMQEKRQMEKILEKASKTHKQRVEEFNRHLDSLTEHYDIPKVSWTK